MPVHLSPAAAPDVVNFWFDEVGEKQWFARSDALDLEIAKRFGALRDAVLASGADGWRAQPNQLLGAIVLLDQFSRNLHRGQAAAFAGDELALTLTREALDRGWDKAMRHEQRQFLLMPLMHSEKIADQQRSLVEYARLGNAEVLEFARLHYDQIARFGRFPGRNAALGRQSTDAEHQALADGAAF